MATLNFKKVGSLVKIEYTGLADRYVSTGISFDFTQPSDGAADVLVVIGGSPYKVAAITDIQINGTPVTNQENFETQIATVFPDAGSSGGGGTLQDALDEQGSTPLTGDNTIIVAEGSTLRILAGDATEATEVGILSIAKGNLNLFTQSEDGLKGSFVRVRDNSGVRVVESMSYDSDTGDEVIIKVSPSSATIAKNGGSAEAIVTTIGDVDIEITDTTKGVILTSPDSSRWRITVNNAGALITTEI